MEFERRCRHAARLHLVDWIGQFRPLGGDLIHYLEAGAGEPLLLVHGFIAWSFTWRKNLPALATQFRTLAPDLRGFGLSQRGTPGRYGLDDQADLLAAFLDALQIDRAALVGHSMGGEIVLRFALRHPDRLKGMVLVAPSALVRRRRHWLERYLLGLPGLGPLAVRLAVLNRRFAARSLREAHHRPDGVTAADIAGYWLPATLPGTARSFVAMLRQIDFGGAASRLGEIPHRALILWGENDPWVPVEHGRRLAELLPHSQLVTLPDCGHVPQEEYPELFHQLVIPFLSSL
ncbi:MAG: alpha/beta fold hydrolase [Bacillota bacterium]